MYYMATDAKQFMLVTSTIESSFQAIVTIFNNKPRQLKIINMHCAQE